jgi:hypothetical protein
MICDKIVFSTSKEFLKERMRIQKYDTHCGFVTRNRTFNKPCRKYSTIDNMRPISWAFLDMFRKVKKYSTIDMSVLTKTTESLVNYDWNCFLTYFTNLNTIYN